MVKGPVTSRHADSQPRVRRGYFECRFGQLHVHNAIPPGGGFDEGTSLICLHPSPVSGRIFSQFLPVMGRDRSVYAPDLPGFGESDPPSGRPSIADYAAAIGDFFDTMRFRQVDVLGFQGGSLIAAELAIARPKQVRRLVLVSVPVLSEAEREEFRRAPWPLPPSQDGSHLLMEWRRTLEPYGANVSLELAARSFADKLHNGPHAWWGLNAVVQYVPRERIPLITQPTTVLRPRDEFWEATARVRDLLPRGRIVELPDHGHAIFEAAPEAVAGALTDFLRG
jgi:pimeloyl-ACP methyl ester carboxylesterase